MCAGRAGFWIAAIGLMFACRALAYDGPLVDGHAHWGGSFDTRAVIERYRSAKVVAQLVMPRYLGTNADLHHRRAGIAVGGGVSSRNLCIGRHAATRFHFYELGLA